LQRVDTTVLGLSPEEAKEHPYIAAMGVYVFRTETLLELLRSNGSTCNDFGSEIIPSAVSGHNVQVKRNILTAIILKVQIVKIISLGLLSN
jgi:ADP-glucose pyrophosphorylase